MLTEADFMTALHGYIAEITGMDGERIFRGYQSRMVLPKSGDYCIYTPILRNRRGTNVYNFDAAGMPDDENGVDTISALVLIDVQCDFYGSSAMLDAQAVEMASRSYLGTDFFRGQDVHVVSSEPPRNLTGVDQSNQYEERWSVTITVEVNSTIENSLPWFEDASVNIVNVDVAFPPVEKE